MKGSAAGRLPGEGGGGGGSRDVGGQQLHGWVLRTSARGEHPRARLCLNLMNRSDIRDEIVFRGCKSAQEYIVL